MTTHQQRNIDDLTAAFDNLEKAVNEMEINRTARDIMDKVNATMKRHGMRCYIKGIASGFVLGIVASIVTVGMISAFAH